MRRNQCRTGPAVTKLQVEGAICGKGIFNYYTTKDVLGGKKGTFAGGWISQNQITQGSINRADTSTPGSTIEWELDEDDRWGVYYQDLQLLVGGWWYHTDTGTFTAKIQYFNSNTGSWVDGCTFSSYGVFNCPCPIPGNNPPYATKVRLLVDSITAGSYARFGYIQLFSTRNLFGWIKNLEAAKNIFAENITASNFTAVTKNFLIDHPLDPDNKDLFHSSLEGPEIAVFYRGEAQLSYGKVVIPLPDYFEALTRQENRTVLITPQFDDDEPISMLAASAVKEGKFIVRAIDSQNLSQKFYWEVKAIRADIEELKVEESKSIPGSRRAKKNIDFSEREIEMFLGKDTRTSNTE